MENMLDFVHCDGDWRVFGGVPEAGGRTVVRDLHSANPITIIHGQRPHWRLCPSVRVVHRGPPIMNIINRDTIQTPTSRITLHGYVFSLFELYDMPSCVLASVKESIVLVGGGRVTPIFQRNDLHPGCVAGIGDHAFIGSIREGVCVVDIHTARILREYKELCAVESVCAVRTQPSVFVGVGVDSRAFMVDTRTPTPVTRFRSVTAMAVDALDGDLLMVDMVNAVGVVDTRTGRCVLETRIGPEETVCVYDKRRCLVYGGNDVCRLVDMISGEINTLWLGFPHR